MRGARRCASSGACAILSHMSKRPRISFGKIALRVGAVTKDALERARLTRTESGGDLEGILVDQGALTPELAERVREAFLFACAVCERCGRSTDTEERDDDDDACRCGGTFVPLEKTIDPEGLETIDPALLQSEPDDVSDG